MQKTILLLTLAFLGLNITNAQVGIGTTNPDASAALDVDVTSLTEKKGFLPPRMDNAERNAISSPAPGLTIYNTEVNCLQWYNGSAWYDGCEAALTPGALSDCSTSGFIPPFLPADETIIKDVTNPNTGQTWMDRNLGAYTADRSSPGTEGGRDCWAYGNLYQWGRGNDGHEETTSPDTAGPVAAGSEGSDFITSDLSNNSDWLSPQDDSRWGNPTDADKGVHDPCPDGYRVPTEAEFDSELNDFTTQDAAGALASPLKLPRAGSRFAGNGNYSDFSGEYWTSTTTPSSFFGGIPVSIWVQITPSSLQIGEQFRGNAYSVRCIKE